MWWRYPTQKLPCFSYLYKPLASFFTPKTTFWCILYWVGHYKGVVIKGFVYEMLIIQLGWIMKYTADISMFRTECESELRFNKTIIKMVPHVGWMVVYWYRFLEDEVSNINAIAPRSKLSKHAYIYMLLFVLAMTDQCICCCLFIISVNFSFSSVLNSLANIT